MRFYDFRLSLSIQLRDSSPKGGQPLIHALLLLSTRFDGCYRRPTCAPVVIFPARIDLSSN
jgi:hypothetical protein